MLSLGHQMQEVPNNNMQANYFDIPSLKK